LLQRAVFHDNALKHWQIATKEREQQRAVDKDPAQQT
jgi:hypothetical protein